MFTGKLKHNTVLLFIFIAFSTLLLLQQCKIDHELIPQPAINEIIFDPTPYVVNTTYGIPPFPYDFLNPINTFTVEGVNLGRKLFYDPVLSADSSLSCSRCHNIGHAFSDTVQFSIGIDGLPGKRNAMPIFNLAYEPYQNGFFWDGRAMTLEDQALIPIQDPVEMHELLPDVIMKLSHSKFYPDLFYLAFGIDSISPEFVGYALAQFTKSIVSAGSHYDHVAAHDTFFTDLEAKGNELFNLPDGGDCFHCHGINDGLFTDYQYRNNGLDNAVYYTDFADGGYALITGDTADYGKFKTPSLRNVELTAPYMHDGRFQTLEEVLDFYSEGVHDTPFTDNFMQFAYQGGVQLTADEKAAIIAFLKTLTDKDLRDKAEYQNPF